MFFTSQLSKAKVAAANALRDEGAISPEQALALFNAGCAPEGLRVAGTIRLPESRTTAKLPARLRVDSIIVEEGANLVFGENINARHLSLRGPSVTDLPKGLKCGHLELLECSVATLPLDLTVEFKLALMECPKLTELPPGLKTGSLLLQGCPSLEALPEGLDVSFLDITRSRKLRGFPKKGRIRIGRLVARDCVNLESLPDWLEEVSVLDLRNCAKLKEIPEGVKVSSWIDISGTQITKLPESLRDVGMRWRGVPVDQRIVFQPESITSEEILQESNAEVRRVMLERMGFERFLKLANATQLDVDRDLGGERRLLKVEMPGDEDLVCVTFLCPSTGRQYVVRVPPKTQSCHAAVAWMAGFDDPDEYKPAIET